MRPRRRSAAREKMPGARWFPGAQVNYARQVLRHVQAAQAAGCPAIVHADDELEPDYVQVAKAAHARHPGSVAVAPRATVIGPTGVPCRTVADTVKAWMWPRRLDVLQGDLSQRDRDKVMRAFKKERTRFLVATDVAARGIDVEGLSFVIHRQLPENLQYYTHRAGRTARAGKKGFSICLIEPNERRDIAELERELGLTFKVLDWDTHGGGTLR